MVEFLHVLLLILFLHDLDSIGITQSWKRFPRFIRDYLLSPSKLCMSDYLKVVVLYYGPCYKGRGEDGLGEMFLLNLVDIS